MKTREECALEWNATQITVPDFNPGDHESLITTPESCLEDARVTNQWSEKNRSLSAIPKNMMKQLCNAIVRLVTAFSATHSLSGWQ